MWILLLSIPYLFAPPSSSSPGFFTSRGGIGKGKGIYDHQHLGWRPSSSSCLQWKSRVICSNLGFCTWISDVKSPTTFFPFYHDQFFQRMNLHDTSLMLRVDYFLGARIAVRLTTFAISTPYGPSSSHPHFSSPTIRSWLIFILFLGWSLVPKIGHEHHTRQNFDSAFFSLISSFVVIFYWPCLPRQGCCV
jgi:hypothetical protein